MIIWVILCGEKKKMDLYLFCWRVNIYSCWTQTHLKNAESVFSNNAEQGLIAALRKAMAATRWRPLKISLQTSKRSSGFYWIKDYIRPAKLSPNGRSFNYHILQNCTSHCTKKISQSDKSWIFQSESFGIYRITFFALHKSSEKPVHF